MKYKPIEPEFRKSGMEYTQLKRRGDFAIYRQHRVGGDPSHDAYEVIRIVRHDGYTIAGQFIPPAETYPSNSAWGAAGWTYRTLREAEHKLEALSPSRRRAAQNQTK